MRLVDEVRAQIAAFVEGRLAAGGLEGWLDSVADEIHADGDPTVRQRAGQVYVLLAELGYGDRTAESARHEVRALLDQGDAPTMSQR